MEKPNNILIASPLKDELSPIEQIKILGDESSNFIPLTSLRTYALTNLPPKEATELLNEKFDFESISNQLTDFFNSVKVLSESTEQRAWLPAWEIHRPKKEGCKATLEKTSSEETAYSLTIKVFGVGGGVSKSRKVGIKQSIEAKGPCLQARLPITFTTQECVTKKGEKFIRANIKDIEPILSTTELMDDQDHCGVFPNLIAKEGWTKRMIEIAPETTEKISLSVESSQGAELSLAPTIAGIDIGLKATLKLEKALSYTYELVGEGSYLAYFPKNAISWYWTQIATFSDLTDAISKRTEDEKRLDQGRTWEK